MGQFVLKRGFGESNVCMYVCVFECICIGGKYFYVHRSLLLFFFCFLCFCYIIFYFQFHSFYIFFRVNFFPLLLFILAILWWCFFFLHVIEICGMPFYTEVYVCVYICICVYMYFILVVVVVVYWIHFLVIIAFFLLFSLLFSILIFYKIKLKRILFLNLIYIIFYCIWSLFSWKNKKKQQNNIKIKTMVNAFYSLNLMHFFN